MPNDLGDRRARPRRSPPSRTRPPSHLVQCRRPPRPGAEAARERLRQRKRRASPRSAGAARKRRASDAHPGQERRCARSGRAATAPAFTSSCSEIAHSASLQVSSLPGCSRNARRDRKMALCLDRAHGQGALQDRRDLAVRASSSSPSTSGPALVEAQGGRARERCLPAVVASSPSSSGADVFGIALRRTPTSRGDGAIAEAFAADVVVIMISQFSAWSGR